MTLLLDPLAKTKLVLCRAQQAGLLLGVFAALKYLFSLAQSLTVARDTHIIQAHQYLALSIGSSG